MILMQLLSAACDKQNNAITVYIEARKMGDYMGSCGFKGSTASFPIIIIYGYIENICTKAKSLKLL